MSDDADDISDALEKNDGNPGTLSFINLKNLNIKTTKDSILQRYKTIFDV